VGRQDSLVKYWYNICFHSAIGRSPFEALFGRAPRHFGVTTPSVGLQGSMDDWLKERQVMTNLIKASLNDLCQPQLSYELKLYSEVSI
jgi:hypothetical protein